MEKVSDRQTPRFRDWGKKSDVGLLMHMERGSEWEETLLTAWNVIYCLRMCWQWSPEMRKLAPSAPSRCLITSRRQARVAVDCHSLSGSWSEWCLFVCPSAAGLISSTNDSAGSSQMSDITQSPPSKPKDVPPCFISLLSDDAALISFSFVSSPCVRYYCPRSTAPGYIQSSFPATLTPPLSFRARLNLCQAADNLFGNGD